MKKLLIYLENFLPSSQAFIINQAEGFHRFDTEIMAGKRINSAHTKSSELRVHDIRSSNTMRAGELLLKIPRLPIPSLFPPLRKADLIHAHFGKNGYVVGPLARKANKPLITTFHGFDATYDGDPKKPGGFNQVRFFSHGRREMASWAFNWSIAVSDFIKEKLLEKGFAEARIHRHYIGIDTSRFSPTATTRRKGLVVSIARFVEYKGHRLMIEALERVAKQGIDLEFAMVGQGPERDRIVELAKRKLPNVTVHENLSQDRIRELLSEAELYLHGSVTLDNGHAEAFGLANLEAQAVGTPVVAFLSGGVGEAVKDGETGFLLAERDVTGMANAIGNLLSDQALWNEFSRRAPIFVSQNFDLNRQTALLEDYYDAVLGDYKKLGNTL
ncbi:glycosyltransferase [Rhizobium sp. 22-785-1]